MHSVDFGWVFFLRNYIQFDIPLISSPFFKGRCPDEVGRRGVLAVLAKKTTNLEQTTPSKFDFVRILPPLLENKQGC